MNLSLSDININDLKIEITDCELSTERTEGRLMAANKKYLAMAMKTGKDLLVVDPSKSISLKSEMPCLSHDSNILDLEFSPFDNNILASSYEDNSILLWKIPEEGFHENITKENILYKKHNNKVYFVNFNPISSDVICSSTHKGDLHVWNMEKNEIFFKIDLNEYITSLSWNPNGDLIGAISISRKMNIIDPRSQNNIFSKEISNKYKSKFIWVDNNIFLTLSWNKENEYRFLKLWDIKKIDSEISSIKIDSFRNISTPFINRELKLIYIIEKEDKNFYVYDNSKGGLDFLTSFESCNSNYSILFDRRGLNRNKLEVDRFARYSIKTKKIFYSSLIVNRNINDLDTLYPSSEKRIVPITFDQWLRKQTKEANNNTENTVESQAKIEKNEYEIINEGNSTKQENIPSISIISKNKSERKILSQNSNQTNNKSKIVDENKKSVSQNVENNKNELEKSKEDFLKENTKIEEIRRQYQEKINKLEIELESKRKLEEEFKLEKQKIISEEKEKTDNFCKKLIEDYNKKNNDYNELKLKYEEKNQRNEDTTLIGTNKDFSNLNSKIKDLEYNYYQLNLKYIFEVKQFEELKNKIKEINQKHSKLENNRTIEEDENNESKINLLEYLNEINQKLIEYENYNNVLQNKYNTIFEQYNMANNKNQLLETKINNINEEKIELNNNYMQFYQLYSQQYKINEELEKNKNYFETKYKEATEKIFELDKEKNFLNNNILEERNKNNELDQRNKLSQNESEKLKKEIEKQKKEKEELNNKIKEKEQENKILKTQIEQQNLKLKKDEEILSNMEERNKSLKYNSEKNKEEACLSSKKNELNNKEKIIKEQKSKIESLERENQELRNKINENKKRKDIKNENKKENFDLQRNVITEEIKNVLKENYERVMKQELKKIEDALYKKLLEKADKINEGYQKSYKEKEEKRDKKFIEMSELAIKSKISNINNSKIDENFQFSIIKTQNDIKCQNCSKTIIFGNGYKCSNSDNYNLCEKCVEENLASGENKNNFIKIRNEVKNNENNKNINNKGYNQNNNKENKKKIIIIAMRIKKLRKKKMRIKTIKK